MGGLGMSVSYVLRLDGIEGRHGPRKFQSTMTVETGAVAGKAKPAVNVKVTVSLVPAAHRDRSHRT
jgi:hypothetical protein